MNTCAEIATVVILALRGKASYIFISHTGVFLSQKNVDGNSQDLVTSVYLAG